MSGQPQPGSETPRRSERLRLIREASAQPAAMTLRASANTTPANLPIARASRAITNDPRRRTPFRRRQGPPPSVVPVTNREIAEESLSGLLDTLQSMITDIRSLTGGSPDDPDTTDTTGAIRTSTPNPVTPAGPGAVSSTTPFDFLVGPPPPEERRQKVVRRITRELQKFMQDPIEGCHVEVVNDNLFNWRARISGPPDTPYEGGEFHLDVHFGPNYPFSPPSMYFLTRIYHCNIADTGCICLDILNTKWSPALSVAKVLLSLQSLLADPNPNDPLEPDVARQYKRQRELHDQTARSWTTQYAKPGQTPPER